MPNHGDRPKYEIRAALPDDADELLALAAHLDSVTLPADRSAIAALLEHSHESFSGRLKAVSDRKYVFVLRAIEPQTDAQQPNEEHHLHDAAMVGTSMIVAQLGQPEEPYIYFDVFREDKYSRDLNLHFEHLALRLGFSYDGPTELGGLVVLPRQRRQPERLGLCISYARFLFIAKHRELFQDTLLAELLPPLEPDGTSHLWNALGRRFTNMSYHEADRLSHENKDFIRDLFPSGIVYASLLSEAAQNVIGEVGEKTKGVEKMLRRVGFYYGDRVDPFDGGPHFFADTKDVSVIQRHRCLPTYPYDAANRERAVSGIVARTLEEPPYFHAIPTEVVFTKERLMVSSAVLDALGATAGDVLDAVPIP